MAVNTLEFRKCVDRRSFVGGSDAWIIMGSDEAALTVSGGKVGAPAAAAGPHPGRAIRFGGRQCEWAARGDQYVGSGEPNR
jgi:hypothetical protein